MGNGRKKDTALWMVFVQGVALSLGVYLLVCSNKTITFAAYLRLI